MPNVIDVDLAIYVIIKFSNYSSHFVLAITIDLFAQNPLPFSTKKIDNCLNPFQPSLTTLSLNLYVSKQEVIGSFSIQTQFSTLSN